MLIQHLKKLGKNKKALLGILMGMSMVAGCSGGAQGQHDVGRSGVVMDTLAGISPQQTGVREEILPEQNDVRVELKTNTSKMNDAKSEDVEIIDVKDSDIGNSDTGNAESERTKTENSKNENSKTEKAKTENAKIGNAKSESAKSENSIINNSKTETLVVTTTDERSIKEEHSEIETVDAKNQGVNSADVNSADVSATSTVNSSVQSCAHVFQRVYWPNAPTCTVGGAYTNVCSLCGAEDGTGTHMEPALDHDFRATELQHGNCVDYTRVEYTCNNCGYSYIEAYLEPEDHDWTEGVAEIWNEEEHKIEQVKYEYCTRCHAQR